MSNETGTQDMLVKKKIKIKADVQIWKSAQRSSCGTLLLKYLLIRSQFLKKSMKKSLLCSGHPRSVLHRSNTMTSSKSHQTSACSHGETGTDARSGIIYSKENLTSLFIPSLSMGQFLHLSQMEIFFFSVGFEMRSSRASRGTGNSNTLKLVCVKRSLVKFFYFYRGFNSRKHLLTCTSCLYLNKNVFSKWDADRNHLWFEAKNLVLDVF